jgi:aminoglycoside phosphotransferase (APT) family kinase protein
MSALEAIAGLGLPVPELVAADVDCLACDVPTLLLTWLPGSSASPPEDLAAFARGLAEPLPAIHRAPLVERTYETYLASDGERIEDLRPPVWSAQPRIWERALELATREPPAAPSRFIHRDYHQGNTLWEGSRLSGIVDWTTGCSGPVGIDLAQMRLNLAWEFDLGTADTFLESWRSVVDDHSEYHPYWDVLDAVDWLGDGQLNEPVPDGGPGRYEAFVARAVAELG